MQKLFGLSVGFILAISAQLMAAEQDFVVGPNGGAVIVNRVFKIDRSRQVRSKEYSTESCLPEDQNSSTSTSWDLDNGTDNLTLLFDAKGLLTISIKSFEGEALTSQPVGYVIEAAGQDILIDPFTASGPLAPLAVRREIGFVGPGSPLPDLSKSNLTATFADGIHAYIEVPPKNHQHVGALYLRSVGFSTVSTVKFSPRDCVRQSVWAYGSLELK